MEITAPATGITRGYAANAADEKALKASGVKTIYRGDKGETLGKFKMRKGEALGVPRGYPTFGTARSDWTKAEEMVHSWGAFIVDIPTGLRSDRNGARMFANALSPPRPTETYKAMQAASVEARTEGRMSWRRAEKIWFNGKLKLAEKVELIGIPQATLYNHFGKTTVPKDSGKK